MDLVLNLSLDGIRLIFDPVTQRLKVRMSGRKEAHRQTDRELELKTSFYKDCSLSSIKNLSDN